MYGSTGSPRRPRQTRHLGLTNGGTGRSAPSLSLGLSLEIGTTGTLPIAATRNGRRHVRPPDVHETSSSVAIGPFRTFGYRSSAALQLRRTGHSLRPTRTGSRAGYSPRQATPR
jgi:hypothetical protein